MLQLGSSKPWPDAMEVLTGQREMDASGLLDYFRPLTDWLEKDNKQSGEYIGWEPTEKRMYLLILNNGNKKECEWMFTQYKPSREVTM
jgi:peptidyl-dipeptidase A